MRSGTSAGSVPLISRELERTPDLIEMVAAARDAGHPVMLIERGIPDAVSLAGIGRAFEIVSSAQGVDLLDGAGSVLDSEPGDDRVAAAGRIWRRFAEPAARPGLPGTGLVAIGGFAFRTDREPAGPWSGFPALLLRVPALAVTRVRGRTFWTASVPAAEDLLEALLEPPRQPVRAPAARHLAVQPALPEERWREAVTTAAARLRSGAAEKVVLAREVVARADGVLGAGAVAGALRAAYPACFVYLLTGDDGTALLGASPELLAARRGRRVTSQPMAGSVARGGDEEDDERLAAALMASVKDRAEHDLVARHVASALAPLSTGVTSSEPEVVRFTNIQHLATTVTADLADPRPGVLEVAAALHPTPAVAGWPPDAALALIDELEDLERGWYAGGAGWVDARGDGEIAVALRCGLLWEDAARLYAGVGIMPGSDPDLELAETELKLRALLGALG